MWIEAALEMCFGLTLVLIGYLCRQLCKRLGCAERNERPYTKSDIATGILFPSIFFFLCGFLTFGICHDIDNPTLNNLKKEYAAIVPCITQETDNTILVSCNAAYQLATNTTLSPDSTILQYNIDLATLKGNEVNWFLKYENIKVPNYLKPIVVTSDCSCSNYSK
jgi:hypothetical protein